jgi:hypothetical protein
MSLHSILDAQQDSDWLMAEFGEPGRAAWLAHYCIGKRDSERGGSRRHFRQATWSLSRLPRHHFWLDATLADVGAPPDFQGVNAEVLISPHSLLSPYSTNGEKLRGSPNLAEKWFDN